MKKVVIALCVIIALFAAGGIAINYISAKDVKISPTVSTVVNDIKKLPNIYRIRTIK